MEPDLMFLSKDDLDQGSLTKTIFNGIPSFIIEIVSPNYRDHDTETKLESYRLLGIKEYWIIDPELKEIQFIEFAYKSIKRDEILTEGKIATKLIELQDLDIQIQTLWKFTS